MTQVGDAENDDGTIRYRLELEGELPGEWATWFGVDDLQVGSGRTVLGLTVTDQAALYGLLRRVHDLHLRLISLTRAPRSQTTAEGTRPGLNYEENT